MNTLSDLHEIAKFQLFLEANFTCPCHPQQKSYGFPWGVVIIETTLQKTSEDITQTIQKVFTDSTSKEGFSVRAVEIEGKKATSQMKALILVNNLKIADTTQIQSIGKLVHCVCARYNALWHKKSFAYDGHDHEHNSLNTTPKKETDMGLDKMTSSGDKLSNEGHAIESFV